MATVGLTQPSPTLKEITPDDNNDLPGGVCRGIYVGGQGNISVVDCYNNSMIIYSAQAGSILPFQIRRVKSSNTTAGHLIALY